MFEERLAAAADAVDRIFAREFDRLGDRPLLDAMRHATRGGKRFRAFLVMESARLHGVSRTGRAAIAAAAVEAVHAYSLVHDDLPCMDDDNLRRGQPTVHVKWDEATAVLVGDALQAFGYELLTSPQIGDPKVIYMLVSSLARASGISGMVLGQALDIAAETSERALTLEDIRKLQACKTGALIGWSAGAGAKLAGSPDQQLEKYGWLIGEAFQITDDIIDVTGDAAAAGKAVGKDRDAGKATFVTLLGLEGAKARAAQLIEEAERLLEPFGAEAETLRQAARFVIARQS